MSQTQLKLVLLQEIRGKSEKVFAVRACDNLVLVWVQQRQAVSRSVPQFVWLHGSETSTHAAIPAQQLLKLYRPPPRTKG